MDRREAKRQAHKAASHALQNVLDRGWPEDFIGTDPGDLSEADAKRLVAEMHELVLYHHCRGS